MLLTYIELLFLIAGNVCQIMKKILQPENFLLRRNLVVVLSFCMVNTIVS